MKLYDHKNTVFRTLNSHINTLSNITIIIIYLISIDFFFFYALKHTRGAFNNVLCNARSLSVFVSIQYGEQTRLRREIRLDLAEYNVQHVLMRRTLQYYYVFVIYNWKYSGEKIVKTPRNYACTGPCNFLTIFVVILLQKRILWLRSSAFF